MNAGLMEARKTELEARATHVVDSPSPSPTPKEPPNIAPGTMPIADFFHPILFSTIKFDSIFCWTIAPNPASLST